MSDAREAFEKHWPTIARDWSVLTGHKREKEEHWLTWQAARADFSKECERKADWKIVHGPGPEDYTESCSAHIGELLTDASEHKLYPISDERSCCCFISSHDEARGVEISGRNRP